MAITTLKNLKESYSNSYKILINKFGKLTPKDVNSALDWLLHEYGLGVNVDTLQDKPIGSIVIYPMNIHSGKLMIGFNPTQYKTTKQAEKYVTMYALHYLEDYLAIHKA